MTSVSSAKASQQAEALYGGGAETIKRQTYCRFIKSLENRGGTVAGGVSKIVCVL